MWAQLAGAAIGVALMAVPGIVGYGGLAADVDHVLGPIAVSVGLMAASEVLRALRWVNVVIGVVLGASCLVLGRPAIGTIVVLALAIGLVGTGYVRGTVSQRFGGGWRALRTGGS